MRLCVVGLAVELQFYCSPMLCTTYYYYYYYYYHLSSLIEYQLLGNDTGELGTYLPWLVSNHARYHNALG